MSLLGFNPLDLTLFLLAVLALIIGFTQGLLRQVIALAVLYIATILGAQYYPTLSSWMVGLARLAASTRFVNAIAFAIIVIFIVVVLNILAYDAYRSTKIRIFPLLDYLGGSILGLTTVIIALSLILPVLEFSIVEAWPPGYEQIRAQLREWLSTARLVPYFQLVKPLLLDALRFWLPSGLPAIFNLG
ncbi:MAG: CvpA family protein [Chloroflexi bacterium]|nr:CvpA family protein [Chloroflexota bacterium]